MGLLWYLKSLLLHSIVIQVTSSSQIPTHTSYPSDARSLPDIKDSKSRIHFSQMQRNHLWTIPLPSCCVTTPNISTMPWKETSVGHFERPFESLERFYRALSAGGAALNREHFVVSAVVRLRLSPSIGDLEPALQHAWKTLRYDFPQIAAHGQGDTYIYEVPTASTIDSWLSETFITE